MIRKLVSRSAPYIRL